MMQLSYLKLVSHLKKQASCRSHKITSKHIVFCVKVLETKSSRIIGRRKMAPIPITSTTCNTYIVPTLDKRGGRSNWLVIRKSAGTEYEG
jgi:hypothetical protein